MFSCRVLWRANATIDWDEDQTRLAVRLDACWIEMFTEPCTLLLITGPTNDAVRETAGQLGYHTIDSEVTEVKYGHATRPEKVGSR
jgi:hypothetical protein